MNTKVNVTQEPLWIHHCVREFVVGLTITTQRERERERERGYSQSETQIRTGWHHLSTIERNSKD